MDRLKLSNARCEALVITCSDFRFTSAQRKFKLDFGLAGAYDLIARPGAVQSLVRPRNSAARQSMDEEIEMLWGMHHFRRALLINHVNCGAYSDSPPGIDEVDVHRADLLDAKRTLEGRYGGLAVDAYLATVVDASVVIVPMSTIR